MKIYFAGKTSMTNNDSGKQLLKKIANRLLSYHFLLERNKDWQIYQKWIRGKL